MSDIQSQKKPGMASEAVRAGELSVPEVSRPISQPIYQSIVYGFNDLETVTSVINGTKPGWQPQTSPL